MKKRARIRDWHREDIKAAIRKSGWTLTALALAHDLPECSVRYALRYPHFDGEMAIAECLALSPRHLWPSRFDVHGTRRHRRRHWQKVTPSAAPSHCQKAEVA